ncbi:MAG: tyrosine-type recombinase/integrase [Rikenellaceae bacterium]|nr:tyrosine-type recombinase/integrase [Rikenellaceae bacterium]
MYTEDFLNHIRAEKRYSPHTVAAYSRDLADFGAFLTGATLPASLDPSGITTEDVREWIADLSERGLSARTVNRMVSALRSYFKYLRLRDIVEKDPLLRIKSLKTPKRLPSYIPETSAVKLFGGNMPPRGGEPGADGFIYDRDELIALLFYSTGIRLAELKDIRAEDFGAGFSELRVRGKGGKQRVVPVIEYTQNKVREFLDRYKGKRSCNSEEKFLFLTEDGRPLPRMDIYKAVKGLLERAGVQGKKSPHVLRHTFATHLLNEGADLRHIQELLGHASLAATQVYTHNSIAKLKEVYAATHPRGQCKGNKPGKGEL